MSGQFAELLDYGLKDLLATLNPPYDPDTTTLDKHMEDYKSWENFQGLVKRSLRSDNIYYAGNAVADAGALLFKAGRDEEATKSCEWGEPLEYSCSKREDS